MSKKTPAEKLQMILEFTQLESLQQLAEAIGANKQNMYDIAKGKCGISKNMRERILTAFPQISKEWLNDTVETPMIIAKASGHSTANLTIGSNIHYTKSKESSTEETSKEVTPRNNGLIPLIPFEAHAGTLSDFCESATLAQCEMFQSPMKGATCAIRITGDSMQPKYESGSIAVLKKINEQIFLEFGKTYVLDTENGAVIKILQPTDKPEVVECVSINPKYPPFKIETKHILGWYRVIGVWSFE